MEVSESFSSLSISALQKLQNTNLSLLALVTEMHASYQPIILLDYMTERQGFEPWEPVKAQRFSRASI